MKLKNLLSALLLLVSTSLFAQDANYLTVAELMQEYDNLNLASGTTASGTYTVRGYVTFWKNGYPQYQNASFYIDDTETGSTTLLQCFRLTGATTADQRTLVVGDYVEVQNAQLANYYGSAELKNGSFTIISDATPAQYKGTTTIANFLSQADLKNSYQLTGVVSGLSAGNNMTYGNLNLTDETGTIYVYGVMDANGQSGNFASLNVENGDTLTIRGTYTTYQGTPQISNAQYISHSKYVEEPPQFMGAITIGEFNQLSDTKNIYQLKGEVYHIADEENGRFLMVDGGDGIFVDGLLDGTENAFSTINIQLHDTLTINAVHTFSYVDVEGWTYPLTKDAILVKNDKRAEELTGKCGDNVYYSIDLSTKTIAFTGTGDLWDIYSWEPSNLYLSNGAVIPINWWGVVYESEYYVVENGDRMFEIKDSVTTAVISEGITSIPDGTFGGCDNLQSVSLPSTLQSIGKSAFLNDNYLHSISFPSSLRSIGSYAFSGTGIESVDIPASVAVIGVAAFWNCNNLTAINVSEQNTNYASLEGVLFNKDMTTLYTYPKNKAGDIYAVPNNVRKIYHSAFNGNQNIISVKVGNNVTFVGLYAFKDCANLISVSLPENLTFIGESSFTGTAIWNDDREWDNGALYINRNYISGGRLCPNEPCPVDENGEIHCPEENNCHDIHVDSIYAVKEGTKLIGMSAGYFGLNSIENTWLKKITIPSSVEYINPMAFAHNGLNEIVWNAKHCHDFEVVVPVSDGEPDSIVVYNPFCEVYYKYNIIFDNNPPVKKISFGKDVEYIPAGLCAKMIALEEVYNYNPEPIAVSENMFEGVGYTCILYVPAGSLAKYEAAPVWRDFYRIREMEDTAIEDIINYTSTTKKLMDNGQLLIFREGKAYSVTGTEVK